MIDWLSATLPFRHPDALSDGAVMALTADGEVSWRSAKSLQVQGSHSARVMIRTSRIFGQSHIDFSGNPSKFLQGHNLFGSSHLRLLALAVARRVSELLGLPLHPEDEALILSGEWDVGTVDSTHSFQLPTRNHVREALKFMESNARLSHRAGRSAVDGGTVYFGKHSRRWALKAYCKGDELEAPRHWLAPDLPHFQELEAYADRALRLEFRFHAMHLKRLGLRRAMYWGETTADTLHAEHLERLNLSGDLDMDNQDLSHLTPACRAAYLAWKSGEDLRRIFPRRSFYRYRSQLLKLGVDIATVQAKVKPNVVPLRLVLQARPMDPPEWARGTSLLFEAPRKVA